MGRSFTAGGKHAAPFPPALTGVGMRAIWEAEGEFLGSWDIGNQRPWNPRKKEGHHDAPLVPGNQRSPGAPDWA